MRAAVFTETDQPLSVEEVSVIDPRPGEVLVRVTASGVCHSDLSIVNGTVPGGPQVLGHEGTGVVEALGPDVTGLAVGDRVIGSIVPTCGTCWYCLRGESYVCAQNFDMMLVPHFRRANGEEIQGMVGLGTFSEMMVSSQHSLVKVETDLPDDVLALIGCGVTTGVGAALNTAHVEPGSTVAVIGCGGVGQAVIQGAHIAGAARIIAVDPVPLKRESALQYGATEVLDPTEVDLVKGIREITSGRGADYTFEVIGNTQTMRQAISAVRPGGTAVLVGIPKLMEDFSVPTFAILNGKRILCCIYGQAKVRSDFPRFIELIEAGRLDVSSMVTRHMHLDDVNEAFDLMQRGEVIRTVLTP